MDRIAATDAHGNIVSVWTHHDGGTGGISPVYPGDEWERAIANHGHAITVVSSLQPTAHRVSGCGVAHDDATFGEARGEYGSMAAYYENGEAFGGRWWETSMRHVRKEYRLA